MSRSESVGPNRESWVAGLPTPGWNRKRWQFLVNRCGYPGLEPGPQYPGCWEFDSQCGKLEVSECVELGVSESEELPVGGPSRHLTLHLSHHCFPIVSKPFMAIFLNPMLLLHFLFDGLANVLEDHCLYPVWAHGPRLALAGKEVFLAHHEVSLLAGTREHQVQGQAHRILRLAWRRMFQGRFWFAMLAEYGRVWHRLNILWCHWCDQENQVWQSHGFSCPWSTFPIVPRGSVPRGIDSLLAGSSP